MESSDAPKTLAFKRSSFSTQLPLHFRYSPSHCWLSNQGGDLWRVGLTKFATRMLGEMVDHGFETEAGAAVAPGQILGWIEGFKAISDLYCVGQGMFMGGNPDLGGNLRAVNRDSYRSGWLYVFRGVPDEKCLDVHGYAALLDKTIDKILEKQAAEGG